MAVIRGKMLKVEYNGVDITDHAAAGGFDSFDLPIHVYSRCVMPQEIPPSERTIDAEYTVGKGEQVMQLPAERVR